MTLQHIVLSEMHILCPSHLSGALAEWHWPWLAAGLTPISDTRPLRWPSGGSSGLR